MRGRRVPLSLVRDESGAVLIYATLVMGVMVAILSLSVNYGYRHVVLNRLQVAADAAALAAVAELPNDTNVRAKANYFAGRNMPAEGFNNQNQDVLADSDIQLGTWNDTTREFTAGGTAPNAVRVVTRRSAANANPHQLFLPGVFGAPDSVDIEAEAVAVGMVSGTPCYTNGFIAQGGTGRILVDNGNQFKGFCMHGFNRVAIGNNNVFSSNARVSMSDLSLFSEGTGTVAPPGTVYDDDSVVSLAGSISSILSGYTSSPMTGPFPSYIDIASVTTVNANYNGPYIAGRIYRITGKAMVNSNINKVAIIANGPIEINSGIVLKNVVLVTQDSITSGSGVQIGDISGSSVISPASCALITSSNFLAARKNIIMGSNHSMSGLQAIVGGNFDTGTNIRVHGAVGIQVADEIRVRSNGQYQSCTSGTGSVLIGSGGGGGLPPRLVR